MKNKFYILGITADTNCHYAISGIFSSSKYKRLEKLTLITQIFWSLTIESDILGKLMIFSNTFCHVSSLTFMKLEVSFDEDFFVRKLLFDFAAWIGSVESLIKLSNEEGINKKG